MCRRIISLSSGRKDQFWILLGNGETMHINDGTDNFRWNRRLELGELAFKTGLTYDV